MTYTLITEAHSAWFSFTKVKVTAIGLDEGRAFAIFSSTADFTRVLSFWKEDRRIFKSYPSLVRTVILKLI